MNNYNPYTLEGKTILITGATSGIGKATAIECTKLGAKVIITGRNEKRLKETNQELEGSNHISIAADITIEEELVNLVDNIPEIDGLVNVAGIVKTLPFQFINRTDLSNIFSTNFFSPVLLTQKIIKKKKLNKEGSIVFISSIDGPVTAHIGNSMYSASKGAISAISKNMAVDLAVKKIRVNSICPGMTETPLIHSDGITQEQLIEDMRLYPLKRYGEPKEIAWAVIYYLSDASKWTTGSQLIIDGGFTLL
jgi:NAD(P)-dependent dehydrogenase (short-subunit alcohol dehydrogenase family)